MLITREGTCKALSAVTYPQIKLFNEKKDSIISQSLVISFWDKLHNLTYLRASDLIPK